MIANKIDTGWFKGKLIDAGITQRELATRMKMDPAALSLMFRSKRGMQMHEAAAIAEILGLPMTDVLSRAGVKSPEGPKSVPVTGWVDPQGELHMEKIAGMKRVDAVPSLEQGTMAVLCRTNDVTDGWLLFYKPTDGVDTDAVGRMSVVELERGKKVLVRVVRRGYDRGTFNLSSLNPAVKTVENAVLLSATPVLWIRT